MESTITSSERELLLVLLQKEEKSLQIEINRTDHRDFRLILKERLKMVSAIIEKLKVNQAVIR